MLLEIPPPTPTYLVADGWDRCCQPAKRGPKCMHALSEAKPMFDVEQFPPLRDISRLYWRARWTRCSRPVPIVNARDPSEIGKRKGLAPIGKPKEVQLASLGRRGRVAASSLAAPSVR